MSSPLFYKITSDTQLREEVYKQFCMDAKRMMLVIDGKYDECAPVQCIYTWLINLFKNEKIGLWFAYWCTQTSLASIYQTKLLDLNHSMISRNSDDAFMYHLVDDGRQHVYVCLSDISSKHAELYLYKPFRVCYFQQSTSAMKTLFYYCLRVHISTYTLGLYDVQWIQSETKQSLDVAIDHQKDISEGQWVILK